METLEVSVPEAKSKSSATPYRVYQSEDYDSFKILSGNRRINQPNFRRLKSSMEKKYLFSPILVNEKLAIIDGQHRFLCCQELKLPVYYIVVPGYGLEEVQTLNTNTANWTKMDYLKSYCDLKNYEYIKFRRFMQEYPDFGINSAYKILTLKSGAIKVNKQVKRGVDRNGEKLVVHLKTFENGELVIPNLKKSEEIAQKLLDFKPYYKNFSRRTFVATMMGVFDNKDYDHKEMLKKLANQPKALVDCINVSQYLALIEEIFNYKRREKVNLRYS